MESGEWRVESGEWRVESELMGEMGWGRKVLVSAKSLIVLPYLARPDCPAR